MRDKSLSALHEVVPRLVIFDEMINMPLPRVDISVNSSSSSSSGTSSSSSSNSNSSSSEEPLSEGEMNEKLDLLMAQQRGALLTPHVHSNKEILRSLDFKAYTIAHGVSFQSLFGDVLKLMTKIKMKILLALLFLSLDLQSMKTKVLHIFLIIQALAL